MPPRKRKASEDKVSQKKKQKVQKDDNRSEPAEAVSLLESVNESSSSSSTTDNAFHDFDFTRFWVRCNYSDQHYRDVEPLTDATVLTVERKLGYKLPKAYIDLCRHQNGGLLKRQQFVVDSDRPFPFNCVFATGLFGIGKTKNYSLCGRMGSAFWVKEWRYPKIGVYFADTPSGGHIMFCLDYRKCGPEGEPEVVALIKKGIIAFVPWQKTLNRLFVVWISVSCWVFLLIMVKKPPKF